MKRIFTLATLFVLVLSVNAQGYRKWTFTNWSAQTVANLIADAAASATEGWSDIEKAANVADPAPDATRDKCFWLTDANGGELKANGQPIPELEGLSFNSAYTSKRSLAIAVNYPSTSLGEYAGGQYLWLGGGGKSVACFTIPKVRIGQKITMTVESHKPSDARGVELYVGSVAAENKIGESFKPTTQASYTWEEGWTLPEGVEADETVDIIVYNTSGCHIYTLEVGDDSQKAKVGYIFNGAIDSELAYKQISTSDKYTVEPIEASGAFTMDALTAYDAIVVSSTLSNADAIASLKAIQPFVPMLNLCPALYTAWGYGNILDPGHYFAVVNKPANTLFAGLELITDEMPEGTAALPLTNEYLCQGVSLSGLFANDEVLATIMENDDAVAIHTHNMDHNGYIFLPYTQEALADAYSPAILNNAVTALVNSKAKVTAAPSPTITLEYKDMNTNVNIKSTVRGAQIFYTTDGSTPNEQSTPYTEPFNISTEGVTVKAVALGDGYLLSDVTEKEVDLRPQATAPTISVNAVEGEATINLAASEEGATIYYNYDGNTNTTNSSVYQGPITITRTKTIYAFVVAEGLVDSELASSEVKVNNPNIRLDVMAHMDANKDEYFTKGDQNKSTTSYFFSWKKDKKLYPYYNVESQETTIVPNPETGEDDIVTSYTELSPEEAVDFENGWMVRSRGQLVIWEGLSATNNIGDTSGRNPASVDDINPDFPITANFVNLADKNTEPADATFPYNAYIVTTQKMAGPFDIVANIGNGAGEESHLTIVLQTATDGNVWESNWQTVGDTIDIINGQRLYHNITRSFEGSDEVYVRAYLCNNNSKAQFYDIYIAKAGEKSQEYVAGIVNVNNADKRVADIFSMGGVRQNAVRRGLNIIRYSDGTTKKVMVK